MATLTITISNYITYQGVTYSPGQVVTMDAASARSLVLAGYAQYGAGGTDLQPPSPPSLVVATVQSATQVAVTWGASTDNVGVTAYRVYRNGAMIAAVGPDTFVYPDTAAPSGTGGLTYSVVAVDLAGNVSVPGQASPVTTPVYGSSGGGGGGSATGAAGGDLTGYYPNPNLADRAVTMVKISATGTPSSTTYLRGDGTWAEISATAGVTLDTLASDILATTTSLSSAGNTGKAADAGHRHAIGAHTHADAANGGTIGIAALAMSGTPSASTYLRGDGTWAVPPSGSGGGVTIDTLSSDILSTIVGSAVGGGTGKAADAGHRHPIGTHSHVDAANGGTLGLTALAVTGSPSAATFLRGDGTWAAPATAALDTLAADIAATSTSGAAAGSTGKAADAGHVHPIGVHNHTSAATGGQLPVGALAATGTPSASTYLRGDGTWGTAPPSGQIDHGAVSSTPRPAVTGTVEWFGTVAPTNALANDVWYDRTTGADVWRRFNGASWVVGSSGSGSLDAGVPVIVSRNTTTDPWCLGASSVPADFNAIRAAGRVVQFQSPDAAKPDFGIGAAQQQRWDSWLQFPAGAFDPTSVAGLLYYWNPNTLSAADGTAVSSLPASYGSPALTSGVAARQPTIQTLTGGQRVIRFAADGTAANDDELLATITASGQPVTVCIVHSIGGTTAQQVLDGGVQILTSTTQLQAYAGTTMSKTQTLPDALGITVAVYNGSTSRLYRNGGTPQSGNTGATGLTTTFRLGRSGTAGRGLVGDVGAVMVYSGALTAAQVDSMGSQLATQYATATPWTTVTG
jgi:hypothetical protein